MEFKDKKSEQVLDRYLQGEKVTGVCYFNGVKSRKPFKITLSLKALGGVKETGYSHSIFCKFEDSEARDIFVDFERKAHEMMPKDIGFISMLKEDTLFIKLGMKDGQYTCTFNPSASALCYGCKIDVEFQPNLWINFEKKTAGLFLKVFNINITEN